MDFSLVTVDVRGSLHVDVINNHQPGWGQDLARVRYPDGAEEDIVLKAEETYNHVGLNHIYLYFVTTHHGASCKVYLRNSGISLKWRGLTSKELTRKQADMTRQLESFAAHLQQKKA